MNKKTREKQSEELQYIPNYDDSDIYWATFDLGCSSALISAGFKLVSLDKSNPRKVQFVFRREFGIDKTVDAYWADQLKVNARAFFDNTKMLKNRIYSE